MTNTESSVGESETIAAPLSRTVAPTKPFTTQRLSRNSDIPEPMRDFNSSAVAF